ncbi:hypothetical protein DYY67_0167 [Candidatus Nitrosotalea sp. TS]|uniref:hypothetical protein n=1 Tax=Candidatus Nitrosotalea sp. TS TaxID=2341020 RepID=UPI00140C605D|nr:hypothetical protein [Candidatus Nitrosotalea sp. TS]NHI03046.1 hypothetical protein [Candidatus Nitrosotalea sp. TS]
MKWLPVIVFLAILSVPLANGQFYGQVQENSGNTNQQSNTFPKIAYTADKSYEVDLTWEPHRILTDQKIIFIFQFYNYKTGELVPMVDYQFVISQDGKELTRISGTTSQAGDYKYFAFDNPGPVTISLEKIGDTDSSASYNTIIYQNPNPTGHVVIMQPPANISDKQRSIFPIIEDVIVGVLIALIVWLARDPILKRLNV